MYLPHNHYVIFLLIFARQLKNVFTKIEPLGYLYIIKVVCLGVQHSICKSAYQLSIENLTRFYNREDKIQSNIHKPF